VAVSPLLLMFLWWSAKPLGSDCPGLCLRASLLFSYNHQSPQEIAQGRREIAHSSIILLMGFISLRGDCFCTTPPCHLEALERSEMSMLTALQGRKQSWVEPQNRSWKVVSAWADA